MQDITNLECCYTKEEEIGDVFIENNLETIVRSTSSEILEKLPGNFESIKLKEKKMYPMATFFSQELQKYNRLVERIRGTLILLREVCLFLAFNLIDDSGNLFANMILF